MELKKFHEGMGKMASALVGLKTTLTKSPISGIQSRDVGTAGAAGRAPAGVVKATIGKTIAPAIAASMKHALKKFNSEFFGWLKEGFGKVINILEGTYKQIMGNIHTTFIVPLLIIGKHIHLGFKKMFLRQDKEASEQKTVGKGLMKMFRGMALLAGIAVGYLIAKMALLHKPLKSLGNAFKWLKGFFTRGGAVSKFRFALNETFMKLSDTLTNLGKSFKGGKIMKALTKFKKIMEPLTKVFMKGAAIGKFLLPLEVAFRTIHRIFFGEGDLTERLVTSAIQMGTILLELPAMLIDWVTGLLGFNTDVASLVDEDFLYKKLTGLGIWIGNKLFDVVEGVKNFFSGLPGMFAGIITRLIDSFPSKIGIGRFSVDLTEEKSSLIKSIVGETTTVSPIKSPTTGASSDIIAGKVKNAGIAKASADSLSGAVGAQNSILSKIQDNSNTAIVNSQSNTVAPQTNINNADTIRSYDPEVDMLNSTS